MRIAKIVVVCLVTSVTACDSVDPGQIESCAKACGLSGQRMQRVSNKECVCSPGDGGAP